MRQLLSLLGIAFLFAASVSAQGPVGVGASSGSGSQPSSRPEYTPWQVSVGYQYNRINLIGNPFNTNGLNASAVRYFGRWVGIEGQLGTGFGNTGATTTPPNLATRSVFVGGGGRLADRNPSRIEPWVHVVIGVDHFQFVQTAGVLGNNTGLAIVGGGGVDYRLGHNIAVRVEADTLESFLFSTSQRHFQAISGLVFNF